MKGNWGQLRLVALAAGLLTVLLSPGTASAGMRVGSQSTSELLPAPFVLPGSVTVVVTPAAPFRLGDRVWTNNAQVPSPAIPDANGCQRVPSSGYIGPGVFASTSYEYSNYWYWSPSSSNEPFQWYIRRLSDDQILYSGKSQGGAGSQVTTSNNWRWQVKNNGTDPQAWNACYETL